MVQLLREVGDPGKYARLFGEDFGPRLAHVESLIEQTENKELREKYRAKFKSMVEKFKKNDKFEKLLSDYNIFVTKMVSRTVDPLWFALTENFIEVEELDYCYDT